MAASNNSNTIWSINSSILGPGRLQSEMTESMNQASLPTPQRSQMLRYNVILATERISGSSRLLELNSTDSGRVMLHKLRLLYYNRLTTRWARFRLLGILCRTIHIETAIVKINGSSSQVILFNLSVTSANIKLTYLSTSSPLDILPK